MTFRTLGLSILVLSGAALAQGRKPAVEDFVGIDVEESRVAPQGTDSLYNLEQDINRIEAGKSAAPAPAQAAEAPVGGWSLGALALAFALGLGLPLSVWLIIMTNLKKKASLESASNIELLEKYRREREKKSEEQVRKVS
jgi:hypothetical protein